MTQATIIIHSFQICSEVQACTSPYYTFDSTGMFAKSYGRVMAALLKLLGNIFQEDEHDSMDKMYPVQSGFA